MAGGDSRIQLANLASFGAVGLLISISYSGTSREGQVAVEFTQAHSSPVLHIGAYHQAPHSLGVQATRCSSAELWTKFLMARSGIAPH